MYHQNKTYYSYGYSPYKNSTNKYPYSSSVNKKTDYSNTLNNMYGKYNYPNNEINQQRMNSSRINHNNFISQDYGPYPFVFNIEETTLQNDAFRTSLWTGDHLQVTLMSINPGEDIGLEVHPDFDQFIRIEKGQGIVQMGDNKDILDFQEDIYDDYAFIIPAGIWHNVINTGNTPLKLYSIYAPPAHPKGTVHETKKDAEAAE